MSLILALVSFYVFELVYYQFIVPLAGPHPSILLILAGLFGGIPVSIIVHQIAWRALGIPEPVLNNPAPFYSDMPRERAVNAIYAVLNNAYIHGEKFHYIDFVEERGELRVETNLAQAAFMYPFAGGFLKVVSGLLDTVMLRQHSYVEVLFEISVKVTGLDSSNSKIELHFQNKARPALFNPWGAKERARFLREIKTAVRARANIKQTTAPGSAKKPTGVIGRIPKALRPSVGSNDVGTVDSIRDESNDSFDEYSLESLSESDVEWMRQKQDGIAGDLDRFDGDAASAAAHFDIEAVCDNLAADSKRSGGDPHLGSERGQSDQVKLPAAGFRKTASALSSSGITAKPYSASIARMTVTPPSDWAKAEKRIKNELGQEKLNQICEAAAKKQKEALVELGQLICAGLNGVPDYKQAFKLFEVASREQYPPALMWLSRMYSQGLGAAKDGKKALHLLQMAAEAQYVPAMYELGIKYCAGQDVLVDTLVGSQYILAAASKGFPPAQLEMGILMVTDMPCQRDHRDLIYWLSQAGQAGESEAYFYLGIYYLGAYGHVLNPDYRAAARAFEKGFKCGDQWCAFELGLMYLEGTGVDQNLAEGRRLINAAAQAGINQAREKLEELDPKN